MFRFLCVVALILLPHFTGAQPFRLPTANNALFDPDGGGDRFFAPTPGKTWTSGCFGCVRTEGWQLHEGLDIRSLERDKQGEPTDPVVAAADGVVAYVNRRPSKSNYGNYLLIRHVVDGMEVYSTYAHLRTIRADLGPNSPVRAGETIGVMGRTANTRQGISKDRAHLHFELNLLLNDRFPEWHRKRHPGQRNDHGKWNGRNFLGIDPRAIYLAQRDSESNFSLKTVIQEQTELCRVLIQETSFPYLKRYAPLVRPNERARREGTAGYELSLNFIGIPIQITPRAASEITGQARVQLLSVNEVEYKKNPCRKLVSKRNGKWSLASNGLELLDLLTFDP